MKTKEKIIRLLTANGQMSIHEISQKLGVSRQYIHRQLNDLQEAGMVQSMGEAPKVYYSLKLDHPSQRNTTIAYEDEQFMNKHFLQVDSVGNLLDGLPALDYWCGKQQLNVEKTLHEFISTRKKYLSYFNQVHLIDGTAKLKSTKGIGQMGIDELYYFDFYAIERFGKTRLGTLMHYAKQGQNKHLMKQIVDEIRQRIINLISNLQIEAVLFVPPTIPRKIQIMTVINMLLALKQPHLKIQKVSGPIVIPQKALSNIFERVANAKNTFYVPEQKAFGRILLIDDAVGSGATLNEIALKLKEKKIADVVYGLAITGSYKGFEVISEL